MPTEYCSAGDIQKRLTENGYQFVADRNLSGNVTAAEVASNIDTGISYAGQMIDFAICDRTSTASARAQQNAWLRDRAIDIAAYRAAGLGGDTVPGSLTAAFISAQEALSAVKGGANIPDFSWDRPVNGRGRPGMRVVNVD